MPEVQIHRDLQIRQNIRGEQKVSLHDVQSVIHPRLIPKGNKGKAPLHFLRPQNACLHEKRYIYPFSMLQLSGV